MFKRILIPLLLIILMASMVAFGASVPIGPNFNDTALSYGNDGLTLDAGLLSLAGLTYASDSFIKVTATDTYAIRTLAETKTDLSLNLVENTALSTWAGTASITTLGTIGTGAWNGDVLLPAYGGTGVANNAANTLTFTGNFSLGLTLTANTAVTMPTSGTLYGTKADSITSAELLSSLTNETGTGVAVFGTAPSFTTSIATPVVIFPATQAPSANANTLDDYEEGTFETAATMSTSGTVTLNASYDTFHYTKIGRLVHVVGRIIVDSVSSPVGTLSLSLPFTSANLAGNEAGTPIMTYSVDYSPGTFCSIWLSPNSSSAMIKTGGDNITYGDVFPAASDSYLVNFSYITS